MQGFFGNSKENKQAGELVEILHEGLVRQGLIARVPNFARWQKDFEEALAQGFVDAAELEVVLVWYLSRIADRFMPRAYSPRGFLEKYPAIKSRWLEYKEQNPTTPAKIIRRIETKTSALVPPPEGASDKLVDWYDALIEDGASQEDLERYAEACRQVNLTNRS